MTGKDDDGREIYTDELGGVHSEGLGWHPDGTFCRECGSSSCTGCVCLEKQGGGRDDKTDLKTSKEVLQMPG